MMSALVRAQHACATTVPPAFGAMRVACTSSSCVRRVYISAASHTLHAIHLNATPRVSRPKSTLFSPSKHIQALRRKGVIRRHVSYLPALPKCYHGHAAHLPCLSLAG